MTGMVRSPNQKSEMMLHWYFKTIQTLAILLSTVSASVWQSLDGTRDLTCLLDPLRIFSTCQAHEGPVRMHGYRLVYYRQFLWNLLSVPENNLHDRSSSSAALAWSTWTPQSAPGKTIYVEAPNPTGLEGTLPERRRSICCSSSRREPWPNSTLCVISPWGHRGLGIVSKFLR